jgi:hypothetical protein
VPGSLFESGIGTLIFSREFPDGSIACATFLLDVHCLGVKNAFYRVFPRDLYLAQIGKISENEKLKSASAECVRKLVEEAVVYARGIGFKPHKGYARARKIFGDVDPSACGQVFTFGKDGKPLYTSGPFDTPARRRAILRTLERTCGAGGFHFIVPAAEEGV